MSPMNPLVAEVLEKQMRSLRRIYLVMGILVLGIIVATLILGTRTGLTLQSATLLWAQGILGLLSLLLLALVLPLVRSRLLDSKRVRDAGPEMLKAWGVPADIEPNIGFQAVYLTRYTAGCVISWGLTASVGLYGLVAGMLGASPWVAGLFLAAAVFVLLLLPPREGWIRKEMAKLQRR